MLLVLGALLIREAPIPGWFLLVYPAIGAVLAHLASRTGRDNRQMARVDTGVVAGTAVFILFALINVFLLDFMVEQVLARVFETGEMLRRIAFLLLPAVALCLWWALERRMSRWRRVAAEREFDAELARRRSNAFTGV